MKLIDIVKQYTGNGLSVIPTDHTTKKPWHNNKTLSWKAYQSSLPTDAELDKWFKYDDCSVALICGKVSGGVECIDIDNHFGDADKVYEEFIELLDNTEPFLSSDLVIEKTQSGGYHIFYRANNVGGNEKLAMRWKDEKAQSVVVETRGEGGYVLIDPSPGYQLINGSFDKLPLLNDEQHELILSIGKSFNMVAEEVKEPAQSYSQSVERPGDLFNKTGDIHHTLQSAGWTLISQFGGKEHWRRPGKNKGGLSATFNYVPDKFYVFTSDSFPFQSNRAYDKFAVEAILNYKGDFKSCARELAKAGYCDKKPAKNGKGANSKATVTASGDLEGIDLAKVEKDSRRKLYPLTEIGNSERFVAKYGRRVRFNCTSGKWHIWNGKKWEVDEKSKILRLAKNTIRSINDEADGIIDSNLQKLQEETRKHAKKSETKNQLKSMLEIAASHPRIAVVNSDFDKHPELLNCQNGIYDLKNNRFFKHDPKYLLSKCIGSDYDPEAESYVFEDALATIFNNDTELIAYVQRAGGISLYGAHLEEVLFFCYGTGKNGKSVFFKEMQEMFGDYHQKAPTEMLMQQHFDTIPNDIAMLPGARFVVTAEMPENRSLNENKVKDLTGGESISARFLHKEFFTFEPAFTLWIYGNHKPTIKGNDDGIWRRINLIPFTVTIPESERRPQAELMADFAKEQPGILNFFIKGWKDYQKNGLNPPQIVLQATKEFRDENDRVAEFLHEVCIYEVNGKIEASVLWSKYHEYCERTKELSLTKKKFYSAIESHENIHSFIGNGNRKFFKGIDFNNEHRMDPKIF